MPTASGHKGAYVVGYTKEHLQGTPAGSIEELKADDGKQFRELSYTYYTAVPGGAKSAVLDDEPE